MNKLTTTNDSISGRKSLIGWVSMAYNSQKDACDIKNEVECDGGR